MSCPSIEGQELIDLHGDKGGWYDKKVLQAVAYNVLKKLGRTFVFGHEPDADQKLSDGPSPGQPRYQNKIQHDDNDVKHYRAFAIHCQHIAQGRASKHSPGKVQSTGENGPVKEKRKAPPHIGNGASPLVGHLVQPVPRGQEKAENRCDPESHQGAKGVVDQVVHLKQAVGPRVYPKQSAQLDQLKGQAHQKTDEDGLPPASSEIIPQIDAQGHQQQDIEKGLVKTLLFHRLEIGAGV